MTLIRTVQNSLPSFGPYELKLLNPVIIAKLRRYTIPHLGLLPPNRRYLYRYGGGEVDREAEAHAWQILICLANPHRICLTVTYRIGDTRLRIQPRPTPFNELCYWVSGEIATAN